MNDLEPAFPFAKWCEMRHISRATGYNLLARGEGPKITHFANRPHVRLKDDQEWLDRMSARSEAPASASPTT